MFKALRPAIARVAGPLASGLLRAGVTPRRGDGRRHRRRRGRQPAACSPAASSSSARSSPCSRSSPTCSTAPWPASAAGPAAFGAWLDSTCDRVADAAVFCSLAWWFTGGGDDRLLAGVALYCLVSGVVVSYEKARAEGLGLSCDVGIAERSERLVLVFAGTALVGFGAPDVVLAVLLWLLAVVTTVTVGQRAAEVRRQAALL